MDPTSILNFKEYLVYELVGSFTLFVLLLLIIVIYVLSKANVPNNVIVMMTVFICVIMSYFVAAFLPFVLLLLAIFISVAYRKWIER